MIPLKDDNPTTIRPVVTIGLIATCVLVFLWQLGQGVEGGQRVVFSYGLIPAVLLDKAQLPPELAVVSPEMTVVTSMFLHGGLLHLGGNMLYLWIFGNNIEDSMGHGRFAAFYLGSGVAAAMTQVMMFPDSTVPMVGASGAISGVLGAYLLLFPRAHVVVGIPIFFFLHLVRLPAMMVLGLWFVFQLLSGATAPESAGVAFWAHIGGFVAGMALIPFFKHKDVPFFQRRRYRGRGPWA